MTNQTFAQLADKCLSLLKSLSPIDTGNLRYNAIKLEWVDSNTARLFVDERIAPYMPYTNEVWEHKLIRMGNFVKGETVERMRTWDNPNEGWFNRAAKAVAEYLTEQTGGELR